MSNVRDPEEVDLAELAALLADLPSSSLEGMLTGKTTCRDAVVAHLECSEAEAERIVDTMAARGFLRYQRSGDSPERWVVVRPE